MPLKYMRHRNNRTESFVEQIMHSLPKSGCHSLDCSQQLLTMVLENIKDSIRSVHCDREDDETNK